MLLIAVRSLAVPSSALGRAPEEQAEAIALLRVRYPSAVALLGEGGQSVPSTPRSASRAPSSQSRRNHQHPPSSARSPGIRSASRTGPGRRPNQLPAWSPDQARSGAELRPAPLDERIARMYYGRRGDDGAMASPSSRLQSRSPSSKVERRLHKLHDAKTVASSLRSFDSSSGSAMAEGSVMLDGSLAGASTNLFAFGLRRGEETPRSARRRSRGHEEEDVEDDRARSPSSLSRAGSTTSVGSREAPGTEVAFGSGRPQRPEAAIYTGSRCIPAIGRSGDMPGVY
jgi:hypothetical protein